VDGGDLAFKATVAVPEAEVYVMMTACLGVIGFVARRRKVSSDGAASLTCCGVVDRGRIAPAHDTGLGG
jgi:hypothetical protein